MKITMIMVMTADGVIAKNKSHNSFTWTSKEDKEHFKTLSKKIGTLLVGGNTFKASGLKSYKDRKVIVLTTDPSKYEFGDDIITLKGNPKSIVKELKKKQIKHIALIGGMKTNSQFLKEGLVNDIYLTIEPKMFGKGMHLAGEFDLNINLKLDSIEKLNPDGTLLLHYLVLN